MKKAKTLHERIGNIIGLTLVVLIGLLVASLLLHLLVSILLRLIELMGVVL